MHKINPLCKKWQGWRATTLFQRTWIQSPTPGYGGSRGPDPSLFWPEQDLHLGAQTDSDQNPSQRTTHSHIQLKSSGTRTRNHLSTLQATPKHNTHHTHWKSPSTFPEDQEREESGPQIASGGPSKQKRKGHFVNLTEKQGNINVSSQWCRKPWKGCGYISALSVYYKTLSLVANIDRRDKGPPRASPCNPLPHTETAHKISELRFQ